MRAWLLLACLALAAPAAAQPSDPGQPADGIERLIVALQTAIQSGDPAAIRALARPDASAPTLAEFVFNMTTPRPTAAVVKERDRAPIAGGRERVLVEILTDADRQGRVSTWRLDVAAPANATAETPWQIAQIEKLTVVSGLYRLVLDPRTEYDVHNLVVQQPDLTLTIPSAHAFIARAQDGPTAMVILGRGRVEFSPRPEAERGQVRTFAGSETLRTEFDTLFLRFSPSAYTARIAPDALTPRTLDARDLRKASQLFDSFVPLSFQVDLGDLSTERWSLIPAGSDTVAEISTRKMGTLTYALASSEPEDISFFDRKRKKNISVYASETKLAARGRFFSDDDDAEYDVTHYDVRAAFSPDRLWVDGTTRISLTTRVPTTGTLTLRLADPLVVRSVVSPVYGRLLHLRVVGQNSILIGFPSAIPADTDLDLTITYGGRLAPQGLDREALTVQQDPLQPDQIVIPPEPQYVYSNRSFWYPQAPTTDFATARITLSVPADYDAIASGTPLGEPVATTDAAQRGRKSYVFETTRPARYLSCIISRFGGEQSAQLNLPMTDERTREGERAQIAAYGGGEGDGVAAPFSLYVQGNPRQAGRTRAFAEKAADILKFYTSILADAPYGSFTLAITESDLPGGHSPAYFAILNQPTPTTVFTWRNDPVSFQNYPTFFLAHEVAHQWWGQAVGWKNYHEQWISEGFAQYFAALYAERERGPDQFVSVLRQMRRTAMDMSGSGPVALGYRLGHLKGDSRIFRALVYNKGAMVLHMLRRLVGDEAFFTGLRQFYTTWRYKKAGSDDFRVAMEAASGQNLQRFFDEWIYGSALPSLKFTSQIDGATLHAVFEQRTDATFDLPVTVTITYADGSTDDVVVAIHDRRTARDIPLKGEVRSVDVNRDAGALADIEKTS